jgi:hypothetical protein
MAEGAGMLLLVVAVDNGQADRQINRQLDKHTTRESDNQTWI